MAHFIVAIDPSSGARAQVAQGARRELESFYGSEVQAFEFPHATVVSWTRSWEPFHHAEAASGATFIWGHAFERQKGIGAPSPDLADNWSGLPQRVPAPLEGVHAGFMCRADGSWAAGADILGTMPVYYWAGSGCVLVTSSPELLRAHPEFRAELDPKGLVGILLTNGLVGGRALLRGVQRLGAGNLLYGRPDQAPAEVAQYRPEVSDRFFGATFEENFARMERTLEACFARHVRADRKHGLLLSGGLDSRLVSGIATRRNVPMSAFSFGSPRDIEVTCASAVAKELRLDHSLLNVRMQSYVDYADSESKWRHLANGFTGLLFHEPVPDPETMPGGMLSGYTMETIVGADHSSAAGPSPDKMSFENFFRKVNRWGMDGDSVKRLIGKSYAASVVDEVLEEIRQTYHSYAKHEFHKPWLFDQFHRERYHTSSVLGLHANWPWPVVPYMDSEMMDLMGGMPYEHVQGRRMQFHLLKQRYPRLARISLDRNTFNMKPVVPRYGRYIDHALFKPREKFYRWTQRCVERRFYHRTMGFDSPGWNAIRVHAEPHRPRAPQVFDAKALEEFLPRPGAPFVARDGIMDTSKMKLLTGFLLCVHTL